MNKIIFSSITACLLISSLHASYVLKPSEMIDAYSNSINQPSIEMKLLKSIDLKDSFKWHYMRYFEGKSKEDLYIRDINYYKDKILASGSYHSSLLVIDDKSENVAYADFYAIKDADHGELGVKYKEAEEDAKKAKEKNDDEWSGASELFVEQGEWIDKNTAFINTMPKYLGRDNPDAKPYLHHAGIHKINIDENANIKELAFSKGEYFLFRKYNDGVITLGDNNEFQILDKNLKLIKSFQIKDVVKADVVKNRLFVLLKGDKKGIYEYDFKNNNLKKIADFDAQYYGRPIKATTSPFLASPDAKYIYYTTPHNYNSKLCKVEIKTSKTICSDTGFPLYSGSYAISPDGKTLAYTFGGDKGQTSIFNLEKTPYLAGYAKGGNTSYAATFKDNKTLAVVNNRHVIDIYELKKGKKITLEDKFEDLKNRIFDFVAPDMNNITFKVKESNGKKKIKTSFALPQHIDGVNLTWVLPDEFKEFINDKNKVINVPSKDFSGEISVLMQLQKDGKIIKEAMVKSNFKITVKK